jgi:hypothetical protein
VHLYQGQHLSTGTAAADRTGSGQHTTIWSASQLPGFYLLLQAHSRQRQPVAGMWLEGQGRRLMLSPGKHSMPIRTAHSGCLVRTPAHSNHCSTAGVLCAWMHAPQQPQSQTVQPT